MFSLTLPIVGALVAAIIAGVGAGIFLRETLLKRRFEANLQRSSQQAKDAIADAMRRAKDAEAEGQRRAKDVLAEADRDAKEKLRDAQKSQEAALEKERGLEERTRDLDRAENECVTKEKQLSEEHARLEELLEKEGKELEKIAGFTQEQAEQKMFSLLEQKHDAALATRMKKMEQKISETVEDKAKDALSQAIQKFASEVTNDRTVTIVPLPDDDVKGRIIGREGRNINAFERASGVDVIIDDTPKAALLSGYDPLRREVARHAMVALVESGKINPENIERCVAKAAEHVEGIIRKKGEEALEKTGITGLRPEVVKLLGRLHFRTSHGQNVLQHSIEVAFLSESLADIVKADSERAKIAGLLHDIGKALSHEVGGKHALISGEIGRKFGIEPLAINAMEAHHEDVEKECIEAYLVQAADAISASRPGARSDSAEDFIKRMKAQEELVSGFDGVKRAMVMNAGRDMWVFVHPERVGDSGMQTLATEIADKLSAELQFPGEIKVVLHRETRSTSVAR